MEYDNYILRDPELLEQRNAIVEHFKVVEMENLKVFAEELLKFWNDIQRIVYKTFKKMSYEIYERKKDWINSNTRELLRKIKKNSTDIKKVIKNL
jgi:S-adenosylmethionine synthetase